jgi:hypothetical protein
MNDEERLFHCAAIMSAAHHMGISIRETSSNGLFSFEWRDNLSGIITAGPDDKERKVALELACTKLTDLLVAKQENDKVQFNYGF